LHLSSKQEIVYFLLKASWLFQAQNNQIQDRNMSTKPCSSKPGRFVPGSTTSSQREAIFIDIPLLWIQKAAVVDREQSKAKQTFKGFFSGTNVQGRLPWTDDRPSSLPRVAPSPSCNFLLHVAEREGPRTRLQQPWELLLIPRSLPSPIRKKRETTTKP
jgi:hypothetical protein